MQERFPSLETKRSASVSVTDKPKRQYSLSINSINSINTDDDIKDKPAHKHRKLSEVELESQLILTAGGKREDVVYFFLKLLFLMAVVSGCCILIFYAL